MFVPDLAEHIEKLEGKLKKLNNTYFDCKDSLIFSQNVSTIECQRAKSVKPTGMTKLLNCEARFLSKNQSFNSLHAQYLSQSADLSNTSSVLNACNQDLALSEEKVKREMQQSMILTTKLEDVEKRFSNQQLEFNKRVGDLRSVVRGMQRHLQCLQTEENCSLEADSYTCLPSDVTDSLCLILPVNGQELFGLNMCLLLGDKTWSTFDVSTYLHDNPWTSAVLITLVVFASIGGCTTILIISWVIFLYRGAVLNFVRSWGRYLALVCRRGTKEDGMPLTTVNSKAKSEDPEGGDTSTLVDKSKPSTSAPIGRNDLAATWETRNGKAPLASNEDTSTV